MRPLYISQAMKAGNALYPERLKGAYLDPYAPASDPLGAALLGALDKDERSKLLERHRASSHESGCALVQHRLFTLFPHLGRSVRDYPVLFKRLRHDLPGALEAGTDKRKGFNDAEGNPIKPYEAKLYRSLYGIITVLHDQYDWPKDRIITMLENSGL